MEFDRVRIPHENFLGKPNRRSIWTAHRTRACTRDKLHGILFRRQCDLIVRNVRTRNSENTRRVIESKTCRRVGNHRTWKTNGHQPKRWLNEEIVGYAFIAIVGNGVSETGIVSSTENVVRSKSVHCSSDLSREMYLKKKNLPVPTTVSRRLRWFISETTAKTISNLTERIPLFPSSCPALSPLDV